jgi:hypothetical protein
MIRRFEAHLVLVLCSALLWWAVSIYFECRCQIVADAYEPHAKYLDPKIRVHMGITPEELAQSLEGTSDAIVKP